VRVLQLRSGGLFDTAAGHRVVSERRCPDVTVSKIVGELDRIVQRDGDGERIVDYEMRINGVQDAGCGPAQTSRPRASCATSWRWPAFSPTS
jgi:hypothetical protein